MSPEKPATSEKPATFASYLPGSPTKNLGKTRDLHAYLRVFTPRPRKQIRDFRLLPPPFLFKTARKNPRPSRLAMRFYSATSKKNPRLPPDTAAFPLQNGSEKPATFTLSYASLLRDLRKNPRFLPPTAAFPLQNTSEIPATSTFTYASALSVKPMKASHLLDNLNRKKGRGVTSADRPPIAPRVLQDDP